MMLAAWVFLLFGVCCFNAAPGTSSAFVSPYSVNVQIDDTPLRSRQKPSWRESSRGGRRCRHRRCWDEFTALAWGTSHSFASGDAGTAIKNRMEDGVIIGCHGHYPRPSRTRRGIATSLLAKPIPTSQFNLEEIEAYEERLDEQEREEARLLEGGDEADQDDDEFDDDDDDEGDGLASSLVSFEIPKKLNNKRIDAAIVSLMEGQARDEEGDHDDDGIITPSRSQVGTLIKDGHVQLIHDDGTEKEPIKRKSFKVQTGQTIRVDMRHQNQPPTEILPEEIHLDVLFEDEHMIVLNKAAGMVVHPAAGNWNGTLVNALAYYLAHVSPYGPGEFVGGGGVSDHDAMGEETSGTKGASSDEYGEVTTFRPGIVHRLDKGTTGVIVVAKTSDALAKLSDAFASRQVRKSYFAVTVGNPGELVVIDKPIGRHPTHRQKMRVVPDHHRNEQRVTGPQLSPAQRGRRALSLVDTRAYDGRLGVAEVRIQTGRTHQIRVHLQDHNTPVYGDEVYGIADWNKKLWKKQQQSSSSNGGTDMRRPLLHAHRLELVHPVTGRRMVFVAPLAEDMATIVDTIWPTGREERPELFVPR